jgi:hypothetical protein
LYVPRSDHLLVDCGHQEKPETVIFSRQSMIDPHYNRDSDQHR